MDRLAKVTSHLTNEELLEKYRTCPHAVEKTHWQIIWLRSQNYRTSEVAELTGYKPDWIRRLVRRYNSEGPDGLKDRRVNNGRTKLLSPEEQQALCLALQQPSPDEGLWTSIKVAKWIEEKVGHKVWPNRGWTYMRELGFTTKSPRPRHPKASAKIQEDFKKK